MTHHGIVDADAHILKPPDIWKNRLPSKYQDCAPQLVKDADDEQAKLTGGDAARIWHLDNQV